MKLAVAFASLCLLPVALLPARQGRAEGEATSSAAFCLFRLPDVSDRRAWFNLAHVQYIEQHSGELTIYYGGGHFGSGHEVHFPVRDADEAAAIIERMQATAARCAGK